MLVLEYGGTDFGPLIQMPAAFSIPMNMRAYDWGYRTEPEPHLGGRRLATPRGKVIGGSSSINGMVFVRGHAEDFDRWEAAGARGWAFKDVLPYFRRMETAHEGRRGGRLARQRRPAARHARHARRIPSIALSLRRASKPATASQPTTTARGRKALGRWR